MITLSPSKGKVMIVLNTAWNLFNFRSGLIRALVVAGYEVVAVAPDDEYASRLTELGCRFVALPMDNKGTNPLRDLGLFFRFLKVIHQERPAVFLGYTIKPNIYGSLAAHTLGITVVNNITGLGTVFIRDTWLTRLVRLLYKIALSRSRHVFFQNKDDMSLFVAHCLVAQHKVSRLPGSGIDLKKFCFTPLKDSTHRPLNFLLVSRLLWDKGVGEYVEAARLVKRQYPGVSFQILGFFDEKNPREVSRAQMQIWDREGVIDYLGVSDDVQSFMVAADCIVLPSYREGVPRTLLEAAAIGRPIVTTDVTGCRDAVDDGVNGFLCNIRDAHDLADKMTQMIELLPSKRMAMGVAGRAKMEIQFDESIVINSYLNTIESILSN